MPVIGGGGTIETVYNKEYYVGLKFGGSSWGIDSSIHIVDIDINYTGDGIKGNASFYSPSYHDPTYNPRATLHVYIDGEHAKYYIVVTEFNYDTSGLHKVSFVTDTWAYQQNGSRVIEWYKCVQGSLQNLMRLSKTRYYLTDVLDELDCYGFGIYFNPSEADVYISPIKWGKLLEEIKNDISQLTPPLSLLKKIVYYFGGYPLVNPYGGYRGGINAMFNVRTVDILQYVPLNGSWEAEFITTTQRSLRTYPTAYGSKAYLINDSTRTITGVVDLPGHSTWSVALNSPIMRDATIANIANLLSGYYSHQIVTTKLSHVGKYVGAVFDNPYNGSLSMITNVQLHLGQDGGKITIGNAPYYALETDIYGIGNRYKLFSSRQHTAPPSYER